MKTNTNTPQSEVEAVNTQVLNDLKHSVLIVSVVMNLFAFSAWLATMLVA